MMAARLHRKEDIESLAYEECPRPEPKNGEVLIRVSAAGVTPAEVRWTLWRSPDGNQRVAPIMSHEFSGVVDEAPGSEADFPAGMEVFAFTDFGRDGGLAEYALALPSEVARKPKTIDYIKAAAIPMSALTAWQGLFERGGLSEGQRVLVHGAAGGVGSFAVQLARWAGAWVAGTASTDNIDFLKNLGVQQPIDYTTTSFEDVVEDVDMVFAAVGGDIINRSWKVLSSGGILVSITSSKVEPPRSDVHGSYFIVRPEGQQLRKIAELVDAGILRPYVTDVFPLIEARRAFERGLPGHNRGKMVIRIR